MAETIRLQGIGLVPAKQARHLRIGDILIWNYGYTSEVLEIIPSKSGKTLKVKIRENGKIYERKLGATRLVGVKG